MTATARRERRRAALRVRWTTVPPRPLGPPLPPVTGLSGDIVAQARDLAHEMAVAPRRRRRR